MVEFSEVQINELVNLINELDEISEECEKPELDSLSEESLILRYNTKVATVNKLIGSIVAEMRSFIESADEDFKCIHGDSFYIWIDAVEEATYEEAIDLEGITDGTDLSEVPTNIEEA